MEFLRWLFCLPGILFAYLFWLDLLQELSRACSCIGLELNVVVRAANLLKLLENEQSRG